MYTSTLYMHVSLRKLVLESIIAVKHLLDVVITCTHVKCTVQHVHYIIHTHARARARAHTQCSVCGYKILREQAVQITDSLLCYAIELVVINFEQHFSQTQSHIWHTSRTSSHSSRLIIKCSQI